MLSTSLSEQVIVILGAVITTWLAQNTKLRESITGAFIEKFGISTYKFSHHNIHNTIKELKFKSTLVDFDYRLKEDVYRYYVNTILSGSSDFVNDILAKEQKMSLEQIRKYIRSSLYDRLTELQNTINNTLHMPSELQDKFNRFRNYLSEQITYNIEYSLGSPTKKILILQILDSVDINCRWFFFYTTEMFDDFNGHFSGLEKKDVFVKKN